MSTLGSDIWFWVYHSLFDPGNIVATLAICGPSAFLYHHFVIAPERKLLHDIHAHTFRTERDVQTVESEERGERKPLA